MSDSHIRVPVDYLSFSDWDGKSLSSIIVELQCLVDKVPPSYKGVNLVIDVYKEGHGAEVYFIREKLPSEIEEEQQRIKKRELERNVKEYEEFLRLKEKFSTCTQF